jgi:hypothetical protein
MKYNKTSAGGRPEILANDTYVAIPHKFSADAKGGDVVEGVGVALYDVTKDDNPNGAVILFGFIDVSKLEESQKPTSAQVTALPMIKWLNADGTIYAGSDA